MRASKLSFIFILFAINFTAQNLTREERIEIIELFAKFKYPTTPEEALVITDKVLAIDSSNITAIGYKAISYFRKKDYHEALKNFNFYLEKKPNSRIRIERTQLKLLMGDTVGAISDIDKVLSVSGYDPEVSDQIAKFFGTDIRAAEYFEKVIKFHPNNFIAYAVLGINKEKKKDYIGAAKKYTLAVKYFDNDIFNDLRIGYRWLYGLKSSIDYELKRYPEAIEATTKSILLYPENPEYYYKERIKNYLALGKKDKSCADIYQLRLLGIPISPYHGIPCDPSKSNCKPSKEWLNDIEAEKFYIKGCSVILSDSSNYKKAIFYYSKALELKPNHIYALARRAYVFLLLNQLEIEIFDLDNILQIKPNSAIAFDYRALARRDLGYYKEGYQDANNAILFDSTNAEYLVTRASIATRMGDTASALADLSKAIQLNPYNSKIYFERSLIELGLKDNAKPALIDILKAIEIEENKPFYSIYPTYHNNCAMAYNKLMMYDKALEQIEKAIAIKPRYGLYYYRCGEIKARMKDMKGACEDWNMAKQLGYKGAEEVLLYNCNVDSKEK